MGSVPTSLGEWIHSPWFDLGLVVWKGYRLRVRQVLAGGHASAWILPFWRGPAPGAQRYQADQVANEQDLQQVLIDMVPTPGMGNVGGGSTIRALLTEFLRGFSPRTLIFLLDVGAKSAETYARDSMCGRPTAFETYLGQRPGRRP